MARLINLEDDLLYVLVHNEDAGGGVMILIT